MEFTNQLVFLVGSLLVLSIFAGIISNRVGAPLLLTFLGIGILFGEDGIGGIIFNDKQLTYTACSFALAVILFDGGLRTSFRNFHYVFRPSLILATLGVLFTAAISGLCIWYFLHIDLLHAMLIGSIIASTDAAAVFLLLGQRGVTLEPRLAYTLEVESGINDPMAVFLTLTFVQLLINDTSDNTNWLFVISNFFTQMAIGTAVGYAGGKLLALVMDRIELDSGLYPILAFAGGLFVFGSTNILNGSGFLAAYIAGLVLGNHTYKAKHLVQQFLNGMAWLSQLGMLLALGLLVTPSKLLNELYLAVIVAFILIFFARPIAVYLCLAFSHFNWREKTFISWVGLRGAIPIYLAIIPVLSGLQDEYFNIAFIVVLCSLILQGWTIHAATRLLKVDKNHTSAS